MLSPLSIQPAVINQRPEDTHNPLYDSKFNKNASKDKTPPTQDFLKDLDAQSKNAKKEKQRTNAR